MKSEYIFLRKDGNAGNHKIITIDSDEEEAIRDSLAWAELEAWLAPEMNLEEWWLDEVFEK